jgi:CBS domain containing-hemolysin-like protein
LTSTIILIIGILILTGFFAGMEIAFITSNKLRIELDKKHGKFSSRIVNIFTKNQGQYIATMLVGNNICLVIYGLAMAIILDPVIMKFTESEFWILIIQTFLSTILILVVGEFIPKAIFRLSPNFFLNTFSLPVLFFYIIFSPFTFSTMLLSNFTFKRIFKMDLSKKQQNDVFGRIDLDNFLNQQQSEKKMESDIEQEIKIFKNVLDFSNIKIKECLVPRNEIIAIDINSSIEELRNKFAETGFSKIIVYDESIDNIIGYVHSLDLFKSPENIKNVVNEILIVPQTMPANKLFDMMIIKCKSIALVVDEFGGTDGIVAIEDIMEEIFGEIEDEHDTIDLIETKVTDKEFIFSGRMEIDYINEKYDLNFSSSEDYETLAGYILYYHERIPEENEEIEIGKVKFTVLNVNKPRIDLIKVTLKD